MESISERIYGLQLSKLEQFEVDEFIQGLTSRPTLRLSIISQATII